MILSDTPLLVLLAALAFAPTGPVGVVTCAAAGVHFLHPAFRPRIQLVPAYVALPVALAAVLWGGLFGAASPPIYFSTGLVFLVAVAVAFDWVFPGVQSLPVARGSLKTACATLHVQLPLADFILRVYYPSRPTAAAKRLPYLIHGSGSTSGLATFMRMPSILFDWLRYVSAPVFLADPDQAMLASPEDVAAATRGRDAGVVESARRALSRDLPVVVFSHGLGGMPDCYISSVISEWVGRGYVVFAPEHADGSAAFTAFPDGYRVPYVPLTPEQRRDRSLEYKRRHAQVKHRAREVSACIDVAEAAAAYVLPAPGHEDDEKDDSRDLLFIKLLLCDRIDLSRGVCAVGHSFGGATCFTAAGKDPRIRSVVALDPWMFPLSSFLLQRGLPDTPVLSFVGDGFCPWRENASALKLLLSRRVRASWQQWRGGTSAVAATDAEGEDEQSGNGFNKQGDMVDAARAPIGAPHVGNVMLHLKGAQHQDFNDFSFLLGWVGRKMGLTGPVGYGTAWPAMQAASACFAATYFSRGPAATADPYATVIGDFRDVLVRDDGPEHTSAPRLVSSTDASELADERAATHGAPDEPGADWQ